MKSGAGVRDGQTLHMHRHGSIATAGRLNSDETIVHGILWKASSALARSLVDFPWDLNFQILPQMLFVGVEKDLNLTF